VKQAITPDYVGRHLAPTSTNAEVVDMVGQVAAEKANVNGLLEDGIEDFLGMVAEITGATYPCKYGGGEPIDCYSRKNLVDSWSHNGDELNTKRMAFIWYFAGQEIYDTANLGSHEQWMEKVVMEKLNVEYYPLPGPGERKSCIRSLYSNTFNNHRYNLFRNLGGSHKTQIQISHPTKVDLGLSRTYRREKTVFYVRTHGEWKVVSSSWTLGKGGKGVGARQCHSIWSSPKVTVLFLFA
jgi:hypothetical protein